MVTLIPLVQAQKESCMVINYYLSSKRPLHIRLRIQPALLITPCLVIKLELPSIKCSLFLIMHRLPVLSINKT